MSEIKLTANSFVSEGDARQEEDDLIQCFSPEISHQVADYHKSLPGYQPTPLVSLSSLAARLQLGQIWVKDESKRFGLNAFKVLGASYAFARHLSGGETGAGLGFSDLQSRVSQDTLLVTATDGNHGYGVAYIAKLFNCKAKVGSDQFGDSED